MRFIFSLITLLTMFGCAMPTTNVRTVDLRSAIAIEGGPQDAEVFIDGLKVGTSGDYNGHPNVLIIEQGTHQIIIKNAGQVTYDQKFYVDSGLKTFKVAR